MAAEIAVVTSASVCVEDAEALFGADGAATGSGKNLRMILDIRVVKMTNTVKNKNTTLTP